MLYLWKKKSKAIKFTREGITEVDAMAKRYGVLPSTLADLDASEYQFNLLVASEAINCEVRAMEKANKKSKSQSFKGR